MKIIISVCTFLLLFQISAQFLTTSEENRDDYDQSSSADHSSSCYCSSSNSESSSDENRPLKFGLAELKQLNNSQRKQFVQKFLLHLMAVAELHAEERIVTLAMRHLLPDLSKSKMNHTLTWQNLLLTVIDGEKVLQQILEQKKNLTGPEKQSEEPNILKFFENAWETIELKKYQEAMSIFQKINEEILTLGRRLTPTFKEQRKAVITINKLIDERARKVDEESREIREKLQGMPAPPFGNASTSSTTFAPWLINAEDIASIKKQYEEMINVIPDANHPEAIKLKKLLKDEGMTIPYFCKTLAEMQNMVSKFHGCVLREDDIGKNILKDTLKQPDFKKCWNLFQECALNLMPGDGEMKDHLRKQANTFLFDSSKIIV